MTVYLFVFYQIKLQNPSNKPIVYQATIVGEHADQFSLPQGSQVQVMCAVCAFLSP